MAARKNDRRIEMANPEPDSAQRIKDTHTQKMKKISLFMVKDKPDLAAGLLSDYTLLCDEWGGCKPVLCCQSAKLLN